MEEAATRHGQALSAAGEIVTLEDIHSIFNELLVVDKDAQNASHAVPQVRNYARTLKQYLLLPHIEDLPCSADQSCWRYIRRSGDGRYGVYG